MSEMQPKQRVGEKQAQTRGPVGSDWLQQDEISNLGTLVGIS